MDGHHFDAKHIWNLDEMGLAIVRKPRNVIQEEGDLDQSHLLKVASISPFARHFS